MKHLFLLVIAALCALTVTAGGLTETYTVIVSLDGFRWDYAETFSAPFMRQMGEQGVKAVMQPSFPSKTFPNHYTLATGLYPDHHGIVANTFRSAKTGKVYALGKPESSNPVYYGGDPIWLTATRQGVISATIYWVGSDVDIQGGHATYWRHYNEKPRRLTFSERADEILRLLQLPEAQRPHLIMAYFEEPDHSGHGFGPISCETKAAFESLDSLLGATWQRIQALSIGSRVNLIVTGDHGMAWGDSEHYVPVSPHIKPYWGTVLGNLPGFVYVSRPEYADSVVAALQGVDHIRAWKRQDMPAYLHYGTSAEIGDVVVLPDVGWLWQDAPVEFADAPMKRMGHHGYDNTAIDMQVGFRAIGPDFKQGYVKPHSFSNVCVYPLLCHLLGITPSPNDGSLDEVQDMLK